MENLNLRKYRTSDNKSIKNIFNYFSKESFACYCENDFSSSEIELIMEDTRCAYVIEDHKKIIGFGYLSHFKKLNTFDHTGVLTYFILPEYTGNGLGTKICNQLLLTGRSLGITNFIANISSKNQQSLNFHKKIGFKEVGKLPQIAIKFGEYFDIIWVQKIIEDKGIANE